jgi:hypothetical protein
LIAIEAAMVRPEFRQGDYHGDHRHLHQERRRLHRHGQDACPQRQGQDRRAEKENDKAPDYRIFAGATEFGAAWKKTSGAGREYLSVKLDDPSFPAPIFASLVAVEGGDGYVLIWSRRSSD